MLCFPNAKINIGLNIIAKRTDGYHDIETIMYPVAITDILEFAELKSPGNAPSLNFSVTGLPVDGDMESNLCIKAYRLLEKEFSLPPLNIHLHKVIPAGAGLGGGSSDAAFMIKSLNSTFGLGLSSTRMKEYAGRLGSDCPFFIENTPVFAKEKGDLFQPVKMDMDGCFLALVCPAIYVNTRDAYSGVLPEKPEFSLCDLIQQPVREWKNFIVNDFEKNIFERFPEIKLLKEKLYKAGALYASMSGSGSSVYGIFERTPQVGSLFENCFYREVRM